MEFWKAKSRPNRKGPAEWFTGDVSIEPVREMAPPVGALSAHVTFSAGARTHWHTHPLGQTIYVTSGSGHAQVWGQPVQNIQPGDVVFFAAGEKHWHGASATSSMSHFAVHEAKNGKTVDWMEPVNDDQYKSK